MPALRILASGFLIVALIGAASADDKKATNKEKILGTWDGEKSAKGGERVRLKFGKDGKIAVILLRDDEGPGRLQGAYEVDGESIKITLMGTETWKIKSLTDKELVTDQENKKATYKRIDDAKAAKNKEKLIGAWKAVKGPIVPPPTTVEFTKEGKIKYKAGTDNLEGDYEVDADSVIAWIGVGLQWKFKTLTETEMVVDWKKLNEKKMTIEFKKK